MQPIFDFLNSEILIGVLKALGVLVGVGMLCVLYRLWVFLGQMQHALNRLSFHSRMIKDIMIEFRTFCQRYNQPFNDDL